MTDAGQLVMDVEQGTLIKSEAIELLFKEWYLTHSYDPKLLGELLLEVVE